MNCGGKGKRGDRKRKLENRKWKLEMECGTRTSFSNFQFRISSFCFVSFRQLTGQSIEPEFRVVS
jgi:hypothetical protein